MTMESETVRFAGPGVLFLAGALGYVFLNTQDVLVATLLLGALVWVALAFSARLPRFVWIGISLAALAMFAIPILQAVGVVTSGPLPAAPSFLPLATFVLFWLGNIAIGLAFNRGRFLAPHSGTFVAVAPVLILLAGWSLPYAAAIAWIGIQLVRTAVVRSRTDEKSSGHA
jgi:hypothetical protein